MYYLIKQKKGTDKKSVEIIRVFEKIEHKFVILNQYLNEHDIKYIEGKMDMGGSGKYCVPNGPERYSVYTMKVDEDGYFLKGAVYQDELYELSIICHVTYIITD